MMEDDGQYFRANAGALVIDKRGRAIAFERADIPGAWQMPQGGLKAGEEPLAAVLREVGEETGISQEGLQLLGTFPELLAYELPVEARSEKTGRGQVQYWFLFRCAEPEKIRLPVGGEFRAWRPMPFSELLTAVVEFKRPVYRRLQAHFAKHLV